MVDNQPKPDSGTVSVRITLMLTQFAEEHGLGQVLSNDTRIVTQRDSEPSRGVDVSFYRGACASEGDRKRHSTDAPEAVFLVRRDDVRWKDVIMSVSQCLNAGVLAVCVLEPAESLALVFRPDAAHRNFSADQTLELPEPLADFRVPVSRFFEW